MMLMELFVLQGSLTEEQRLRISERLVTAVMSAEQAPADLIDRGRAMTYVAIHESAALASGRPRGATEPPL